MALLADLGCICVNDNTQNSDVCGTGVASRSTGWADDASDAKLTDLAGKCTTLTLTDLTPANIRSAVAAALAKIKQTAGADFKLVMGKQASGNTCAATNGAGCVEYEAAVTAGKLVQIEPTWAAHMLAAANGLQQLEEAEKTAEQTRAHLEDLRERAKALHTTLLIMEDTISTQTQQTDNADPVSERQICKPQNATPAECPEKHCDYDVNAEDGKKCKAKPRTESTAAGATVEGAAAEATGCASHFNDKEKCEKMNEGKERPVFAWKKGGEGDKDKDKLRCRNGNFLVTKKSSLIMSAAFVSFFF
ncbi:Trypanosomal VSG domain/Trypanosome variant surface glycoprotein C-terminal domain containing protein, putative [Trypanosoma equiperdum]|uniref:Trypanosomal VSG domain/Trypanosome variant surface glycoprotein C-terminal domain containing protein, putative n=1 Tax=Trypanosoma equiperdum TaxID=5694 RepID=A0A1G4I240_TRYEQ|nr:Trypanosomal VSG domain/Trypanosome variant surface glycoprotein C-terminal domain containing protein, putative [Trypanosoma equiperdum]